MARWVGCVAVAALALVPDVIRAEPAAQVRVLSGPAAPTVVTVRASSDVQIEDRTPGASPNAAARGPASSGETFTGELTLFLRGTFVSRQAVVEVGDALVSAVRLFPEEQGTTVLVFVRQPVTYSVSRPSALGEIAIEVRGRTRPLQATGKVSRGGVAKVGRPKPRPGAQEVAVDAEQLDYDRQANVLVARGGVTLTRGDMTLTADEVRYDREHATVDAQGHVVIVDPEATVDGEAAHLNLDDESGWVDAAQAELHPGEYTLEGQRLDKQGGPLYHVKNGVFTTCKCGGLERPSWSLAGKETDIKLEGHGVMRGATFRVKDVPVFYFPYFLFPAKTTRETGFLFPRVGYSNRRGFQWEQPFYWAINKSSDATIAVDVETAQRVGMIGEYRYALSRRTQGNFTLAYYNEQIRGRSLGTIAPDGTTQTPPENRFAIAGHHIQPFVGGSKLYVDVFAISDDTFLKEINTFAFGTRRDLALRSSRFTASHAGVIKTWTTGFARIDNVYYQDLITPQELALQKLPQIEAEHSIPLADGLAVGRLAGDATYFSREQGYEGVRGDLAPELFVPFNLGRAVSGSVTGGLRETAYHLTDREQVAFNVPSRQFRAAPDLPLLDENRTRELGTVSGRLGTEFARVFGFQHLGFEKIRHSIEPEARYLFVPSTSRPVFNTELPLCTSLPRKDRRSGVNCGPNVTSFSEGYLFDEKDAINRRNFISYGITTRILGRGATSSEAAARAEESAEEEDADVGPQPDVDQELLAPGLPQAAIPDFVGPPAQSATPGSPPTAGASRELLRASVLHGYDISRTLVQDSHASDLDLGLRLTPLDYLGLSYGATFGLNDGSLRGTTAGFFIREPWVPPTAIRNLQSATTLGISYRFVEENVNEAILKPNDPDRLLLKAAGVKEISGSLYWRVTDYLGLAFIARYDLLTTPGTNNQPDLGPHFLERDYLVHLISRCNCWVLDAGVSDKFNPDERLFRIQFTLVGLGSFGRGTAPHNFVGLAPLSGIGYRRPSAIGGNY